MISHAHLFAQARGVEHLLSIEREDAPKREKRRSFMSVLRRVSRASRALSRPQLDERTYFGAQGEEYASSVLDEQDIPSRVTNPIVLPSHGRSHTLESDLLVYTRGNLFCIEIKYYKGRISYPSESANTQRTPDLIQKKTGKYGE
jgi:hypothetical protein